uniref:Nuclear autoantigenic sperm protein (histone-binding) n=1 Tax=Lepisosteus oculatus TaxID=7918 RepID=W5MFN2_LEPOC
MPEETPVPSTTERMEEGPSASSSAPDSPGGDVMEEAKKLIGTGNRHLVMGDVVSAVNAFQEACAMLGKKYGDTADECAEAFFLCGKSLIELARMENTVLGNALEGVPEEEVEEGEKADDSKVESVDNVDEKTRDELREQVYDAMAEKEDAKTENEESKNKPADGEKTEGEAATVSKEGQTESPAKEAEEVKTKSPEKGEEETTATPKKPGEEEPEKKAEEKTSEAQDGKAVEESAGGKKEEPSEVEEAEEEMEEGEGKRKGGHWCSWAQQEPTTWEKNWAAGLNWSLKTEINTFEVSSPDGFFASGGEEEEDDDDNDGEGTAEDKDSEEEEVGNLQLAWEMLEVAKVIYKRKDNKDDQLMAAQAHLKLGEVSVESGNYVQALEDFQECLSIQLKHLLPHSRLLAETHYQLGLAYGYTNQYDLSIQHFTSSVQVIESRLAMLQEAIDKAEGAGSPTDQQKEMEELKQLLPDIREKIEDAKESQKTASVASEAIQQTLSGSSSSSGFVGENGGPSASILSQIPVKPADGASSSKSVTDISHLVRKKRKPEEESPLKNSDAKKPKQETAVNGSGDCASNDNGVEEKMEQDEPVKPAAPVETSA